MNGFTTRPLRWGLIATVSILILLSWTTRHNLTACPFCLSPPQTLAEQIAQADIVLIAELLRFQVHDNGTRPESILRIRQYLRGTAFASARKELAVGQAIEINFDPAGQPGDLFLLCGELAESRMQSSPLTFASQGDSSSNTNEDPDEGIISAVFRENSIEELAPQILKTSLVIPEMIAWTEKLAVSRDVVDYLNQMPETELPQKSRLPYFMNYLEHADSLVAIDAWAEFGNSSYEDVKSVSHLMSAEKLRRWIGDPNMTPERLGLYGMMLGLCGTDADAEFLFQNMYAQSSPLDIAEKDSSGQWEFRFGAEGLMAGYLLLTGDKGLQTLDTILLDSADTPDSARHAFIQTLQFMWSYESQIIQRARVCQSMRRLLDSESMREIAITNLARWEDWDTLPVLIRMFKTEAAADRSTQTAIVQFAKACLRRERSPQHLAIAEQAELFLCEVHASPAKTASATNDGFRNPQ